MWRGRHRWRAFATADDLHPLSSSSAPSFEDLARDAEKTGWLAAWDENLFGWPNIALLIVLPTHADYEYHKSIAIS